MSIVDKKIERLKSILVQETLYHSDIRCALTLMVESIEALEKMRVVTTGRNKSAKPKKSKKKGLFCF